MFSDEPLGLSASLQRAVLVLIAAGLLVALVLARYHDEEGLLSNSLVARPLERCKMKRRAVLSAVAVLALGCQDAGRLTQPQVPLPESLPAPSLVVTAATSRWQSISAGGRHSCGLTPAGAAYCWGWNGLGGLGDGTNTDSNVPVAVSGGLTFQAVSAGRGHSCGLTTAGAAYCWGWNDRGQLGDGTNTDSNVPVAVSGGLTFQSVSAGVHSCGLTTAEAAYCWGGNFVGQLGDGTFTDSNVPVAVSGGLTFQSMTAGTQHSCGVTPAGTAHCWGNNSLGGLGNGTFTDSNVPVAVSGGLTFQAVSAGTRHSCGVTTAGTAYCWGGNGVGELGNGMTTSQPSKVPVAVSGGLTFQSLSVGNSHSCGLTPAGAAYCWGSDRSFALLGNGTNTGSNVPVAVSGGMTFQSVSAGYQHSCGVATDGYCWGIGFRGELGNGTNTTAKVPVLVVSPVPDRDGDGIYDDVDDAPDDDTNWTFTDDGTVPATTGTLTLAATDPTHTVFIADDPTAGAGVQVGTTAGPTTGPQSEVVACGGSMKAKFRHPSDFIVTCGSADVWVVTGPVDLEFTADDGTVATATLDDGYGLTFHPETGQFEANEDNPDAVTVEIGGVELPVEAGVTLRQLAIDLKPGGGPNCVNPNSKGRTPVAVLATDGFDPKDVDAETVMLQDVPPIRWSTRKDVSGDGLRDLVLQYATRVLAANGHLTDGASLILSGALHDGTPFWGTDVVYLAGGLNCF